MGEGELKLCLPSPKNGRGAGGEGKDLSLHWDAPNPHRRLATCGYVYVKKIDFGK
jgi:hypothetical protein